MRCFWPRSILTGHYSVYQGLDVVGTETYPKFSECFKQNPLGWFPVGSPPSHLPLNPTTDCPYSLMHTAAIFCFVLPSLSVVMAAPTWNLDTAKDLFEIPRLPAKKETAASLSSKENVNMAPVDLSSVYVNDEHQSIYKAQFVAHLAIMTPSEAECCKRRR